MLPRGEPNASASALLPEREVDGLLPRHRSPCFEGSSRPRLAEPRAGCAEVTLAKALEDSRPGADLQLLPSRFDGAFEVNCILVSSETPGDHGETEDFDDLPVFVSSREVRFENAQTVLLRQRVVASVLSTVREVVECVPDVLTDAPSEFEGPLEKLQRPRHLACLVQRPTQRVESFDKSRLVPDVAQEL